MEIYGHYPFNYNYTEAIGQVSLPVLYSVYIYKSASTNCPNWKFLQFYPRDKLGR